MEEKLVSAILCLTGIFASVLVVSAAVVIAIQYMSIKRADLFLDSFMSGDRHNNSVFDGD